MPVIRRCRFDRVPLVHNGTICLPPSRFSAALEAHWRRDSTSSWKVGEAGTWLTRDDAPAGLWALNARKCSLVAASARLCVLWWPGRCRFTRLKEMKPVSSDRLSDYGVQISVVDGMRSTHHAVNHLVGSEGIGRLWMRCGKCGQETPEVSQCALCGAPVTQQRPVAAGRRRSKGRSRRNGRNLGRS